MTTSKATRNKKQAAVVTERVLTFRCLWLVFFVFFNARAMIGLSRQMICSGQWSLVTAVIVTNTVGPSYMVYDGGAYLYKNITADHKICSTIMYHIWRTYHEHYTFRWYKCQLGNLASTKIRNLSDFSLTKYIYLLLKQCINSYSNTIDVIKS